MFYIGFYLRFDPPTDGVPIPPAGYVSLVAIYLFAAIYQFGWGPVVWTYCSVSYLPTLLQTMGHSCLPCHRRYQLPDYAP